MEKANKRRGLITVVVVLSLIAFFGIFSRSNFGQYSQGQPSAKWVNSNAYSDGAVWGEAIRVAASSG
jgi:uncharacterized membrane protein